MKDIALGGVIETPQDATPAVPVGDSVQLPLLPENDVMKLTLPVGDVGEFARSVTVAVHEVGEPAVTVVGEQLTPVLVVSTTGVGAVAVTEENEPLLPEWVESPPYTPRML